MSSKKQSAFFKPPPETFDLFKDLVEEDDAIEEEPELLALSSTQNQSSNALFTGLFGSGQKFDSEISTSRNFSPHRSHERSGEVVPKQIYGNNNNNDDDEIAVFRNRFTQRSKRLPRSLRGGQYQMRQPYQDNPYEGRFSAPRHHGASYAHVHTVSSPISETANMGRGRSVYTNAFMSQTQRKRIEQQERLENAETQLRDFLANSPGDIKFHAKLLQLEAYKRRLAENETNILNSAETRVLYDIDRAIERRRVANESKEFIRQAEAEAKLLSRPSYGISGQKRAYEYGTGSSESASFSSSASPFPGSEWTTSRTVGSSISSYSPSFHPTTGGKTVDLDSSRQRKRQKVEYRDDDTDEDDDCDGEDEEDDDEDSGDDDSDDDGTECEKTGERKTYGGKTIAEGNAYVIETYDVTEALKGENEDGKTEEKGETQVVQQEENGESTGDETDRDSDIDGEMGDDFQFQLYPA